ncbi:MAG: hypothetical protein HRT69_18825 [Flavobacteriaceae bacterium]|nr:hypothetical protein [Flavobacteriaceae bacterium]
MSEKLDHNGIFLLQETHSTLSCEENWKRECEGNLLFSHGTSNSTGVLIGFTKNFDVTIDQTTSDKNGRILISDVTVNSVKYRLINIYNDNTEQKQINTFNSLKDHLLKHKNDDDRHPILTGDLNFIFDIQRDALGGSPTLKNVPLLRLCPLKMN